MIGAFGIVFLFISILFSINGDTILSLGFGILSIILFIIKILEERYDI